MPNLLPSNFTASTTNFMTYLYAQFQASIILIISVIVVGAIAGMIIHHFKK